MAKMNITGHGQDYCGAKYCKGEICGGPAQAKKSKRTSIYDSQLDMIQAGSDFLNQGKATVTTHSVDANEAKFALSQLIERDSISEVYEIIGNEESDKLNKDVDLKEKLQRIAELSKVPSKDLADLYKALQDDKEEPLKIAGVDNFTISGKNVQIISLDDGQQVYHVSQRAAVDLQEIARDINNGICPETQTEEFWDEVYHQSSPETKKQLKAIAKSDNIENPTSPDEIVDGLHENWLKGDEFGFDDVQLEKLQEHCPELTSERLAEIVLPIRQRERLNGADELETKDATAEDEVSFDDKVRIGKTPTNWRTTHVF